MQGAAAGAALLEQRFPEGPGGTGPKHLEGWEAGLIDDINQSLVSPFVLYWKYTYIILSSSMIAT